MLKSSSKMLSGTVAMVALATAFTAVGGAPARAQSLQPLYSGGDTLAAFAYRDLFNCYGSESSDGSLGGTSGTNGCVDEAINDNAEVLYAPVTAAAAQAAYIANNPASLGTPNSVDVPYVSGDFPNYPYSGLAFAGSDAPLSAAQITSTQVPMAPATP